MGYRVTVFEASNRSGGMMYHGIPEFRLARAVIEKEIQKTIGLGVEIKLNTPLNENFGIQDLKSAGGSIEDAVGMAELKQEGMWLPRGNYF